MTHAQALKSCLSCAVVLYQLLQSQTSTKVEHLYFMPGDQFVTLTMAVIYRVGKMDEHQMQHRDRCASQWRSNSYCKHCCTGQDEQQQQTYVIINQAASLPLSNTLEITESPQETRTKKSRILILQIQVKNNPCIESPSSRKIPSDI